MNEAINRISIQIRDESNIRRSLRHSFLDDLLSRINEGVSVLKQLVNRSIQLEPARTIRFQALQAGFVCPCEHHLGLQLEKRTSDIVPDDIKHDSLIGGAKFRLSLSYKEPGASPAAPSSHDTKWSDVLVKPMPAARSYAMAQTLRSKFEKRLQSTGSFRHSPLKGGPFSTPTDSTQPPDTSQEIEMAAREEHVPATKILHLCGNIRQPFLYGSSWMPTVIRSQDIYLIRGPDDPICDRFFVLQSLPQVKEIVKEEHQELTSMRNQTLFYSGVFLMELAFGKPLELLRSERDKSGIGSQFFTGYRTTKRLVDQVTSFVGPSYGSAVSRCIDGEFHSSEVGLEDTNLSHDVHTGVVMLLEKSIGESLVWFNIGLNQTERSNILCINLPFSIAIPDTHLIDIYNRPLQGSSICVRDESDQLDTWQKTRQILSNAQKVIHDESRLSQSLVELRK
ncbi:hypothetical protein DER46DRAFT_571765 [Fusarium sp. MPI-SDFR-AT-0072]|nr:hypothetical protein DER46DRAFT_571765 [Fusarium sp. MPI-SDFR-AT-0072]